MDRRAKILTGIDLESAKGLEIGALASPQVRPHEGDIFFVDHVDTPALKRKYAGDPNVDTEKIVNVGGVWGDNCLRECVGDRTFDYVVACHVIEHVPDMLTWLEEIRSVLSSDGTLRLVIPDKRFTFDYLRPLSQPCDLLDAYLHRYRKPPPRTLIEYVGLVCDLDVAASWRGKIDASQLCLRHSLEIGLNVARDALERGTYHDAHCWVVTPGSFAKLMIQMADLKLLNFACERFFNTERDNLEFFVHLRPCLDPAEIKKSFEAMAAADDGSIGVQNTSSTIYVLREAPAPTMKEAISSLALATKRSLAYRLRRQH